MFESKLVVNGDTGFILPSKRLSQTDDLTVESLQPSRFVEAPCACARDMQEREVSGLCGLNTSRMESHQVAGFIVEQHGKAQINMQ